MPAIRTFAKPVNDSVTVHIPKEYRSYSFEIVLVPVEQEGSGERNKSLPPWAGLCENAIARNLHGPHDLDSIRESIMSAERVSVL
jgi:hypothetical protein